MTTINDVAAHAGVGIGTVSRVLNDSPSVSPETRRRVIDSIATLGYTPQRSGRKAAPRSTGGYINVLVHFFEGPSSYQRLRGIVTRLQPHGFEVVLDIVDSPERARRRLMELPRNRQLDGLVVMSLPLVGDEAVRLSAAPFPTVLLDTVDPDLPSVTIDDLEGGRMATRHLIDLGHERIAFIGEPHRNPFGFIASRDREQGYLEVMGSRGLAVPEGFIKHGPHLRAAGRQMAMELFAHPTPPTAIVAASDLQAFGVLEAAKESGRELPRDLSVIGYDDIDLASYLGLSTVRQPLEESGRRAADMVLASIESGGRPTVINDRLPLELVIRNTSGAAPSRRAPAR